jgi:hypothetical protein
MDAPIVTLILGFATILASGVTSSMVTYRLNRNRNQTVFLREKAEQLYLSADEFGKTFSMQIITYLPLLNGRIDYNQVLDMQIEQGPAAKKYGGAETMTMLVEIYFPSVRPALEEVWKARDTFNRITAEIKFVWERDGDVSAGDLKSRFMSAALAIDKCIKALQNEIVTAARVHAGAKQ